MTIGPMTIGQAVRDLPPLPPLPGLLPGATGAAVQTFREAMNLLAGIDPGAMRSVLAAQGNAGGAQGGAQTAGSLLFLFAAIRGGDVRGWLGERGVKSLESAGRSELVAKLGAEMGGMARAAAEAPQGEWRSFALPWLMGGMVTPVSLHLRRDHAEGGEDDKNPDDDNPTQKHFVIEVSLSKIGPLQLDGLLSDKQFDLTVRTAREFASTLRDEMRSLFRNLCDGFGLTSALRFDSQMRGWITLQRDRTTP